MKVIKITNVKYLKDYTLEITFNDGKSQKIDFQPFLKNSQHPEILKYLNHELFKQYEIIDGDLIWNDYDLIFPIWDLYQNTILPKAKSEEIAS